MDYSVHLSLQCLLQPTKDAWQHHRSSIVTCHHIFSYPHLLCLALSTPQVRQQEGTIAKLQQQLQQEQAARMDAQERLNMQHFKANLLADMMVLKLLDIQQPGQGTQPGMLKLKQQQQAQGQHFDQQQQQWQAGQQRQDAQGMIAAVQQGGSAAAGVLEESSFE
jgi:hypothetical protein